MIDLRDYQEAIAGKAAALLKQYGIAYLAMEVRTGKTLTALSAADRYGAKKVLFLTKKRAIETGTILNDYEALSPRFEIQIINNESLHKVTDNDFDFLISDEHHRNGSYAKPNKTTKEIRKRFSHLPMIFLSGTPAIESGSQYFHQFWISRQSPWAHYPNFYRWADNYVRAKMKHLGSIKVVDYSDSIDTKIMQDIGHLILTYPQQQAGFASSITEHIIEYTLPEGIRSLVATLLKDQVVCGSSEDIIADTAASMLSKIHQIENGTVITSTGNAYILDTTKAIAVRDYFVGKKIAIFYYFQKELDLLQQVFGDTLTTDIHRFNSDKTLNFAIQQISGSEAISLKAADALVYYNFGYSGRNFAQGRDRMTTKDREDNNVYFVIGNGSINEKIYKAVKMKKKYNDKMFIKDYNYGSRAAITK